MTGIPAVSIVVPVFNAEVTIEHTLQSLLNQRLEQIEVIVVDDASEDRSADIVSQLAASDSRIVSIRLPHNMGVHEARLAGIDQCRAPWIGFLDADDIARADMFSRLLEEGENTGADIVVCGSWRVNESGKRLTPKIRFNRNETVTRDVFARFCRFEFGTGMLWNKLFKRDIILPSADLRFPWRQNINEDLILNIGCFHRAQTVRLVKDMLHEYALRNTSVTTSIHNARAYVDTYRAYALAVQAFAPLGREVLDRIADMYRVQLAWVDYQVDSVSELREYLPQLEEATKLLCNTNPESIGLVVSRAEPPLPPLKKASAQMIRKIIAFIRV